MPLHHTHLSKDTMARPTAKTTTKIPLFLALLLTALTPLTTATPTPNPQTCSGPNFLTNPSFDLPTLTPWLPLVQSAFSPTRGILTSPSAAHTGSGVYHAHSLSSIPSSLALSQSGISVERGREVECFAWVRGSRGDGGVTTVGVWLDGVGCGKVEVAGGQEGWVRVGGRVKVGGAEGGGGQGSTVSVVVGSEKAGEGGWEVWVDDVGVVGC